MPSGCAGRSFMAVSGEVVSATEYTRLWRGIFWEYQTLGTALKQTNTVPVQFQAYPVPR